MTTFEIIRNIFAVIGVIVTFCGIGCIVLVMAYGVDDIVYDEHSNPNNSRG